MVKITEIPYTETLVEGYKSPSNFYIRNCFGDYVYFHTRDRKLAQDSCNEKFGLGQYTVNASKMSKAPDSESAVGRLNTKSRMNSKGVN
jgi:hypothetical protein